jgi:hypothetical protein
MQEDDRELIELDFSQSELYELMLMAHKRDMTLNQLVERLLTDFIESIDVQP